MKYEIVSSHGVHLLQELVWLRLETGWKLQGGVSVCKVAGMSDMFFQAMVKE